MEAITISPPDVSSLTAHGGHLAELVNNLVIDSPETYMAGAELVVSIKQARQEAKDRFADSREAAKQAKAAVDNLYNSLDRPLAGHESTLKGKLQSWDNEQERIRREQQQAAQLAAQKAEEDRRLREAEQLEAAGKPEEAARVIERPVVAPPVVLARTTPKVEGLVHKFKPWDYRIVDESKLPRQYLTPDITKIRGVVRAMGEQTNIPGIEVYREKTVAVSGK